MLISIGIGKKRKPDRESGFSRYVEPKLSIILARIHSVVKV